MYIFGELPSDLNVQDESYNPPPPAWFRPESGITTPEQASAAWYSYPYAARGFFGLGDREGEIEVNPVEELRELKFKQEMNKKIPIEANRYTKIDPLSPLFRDKKAKFGYGGIGEDEDNISFGGAVMKLAGTAMSISNFYHGYRRNDGSILWGLLWILLGPIGVALSLSQGYGVPIQHT